MKLSDTQGLILSRASQHEQGLAAAPKRLPAAARNAVFRSMLKNGLLEECAAPREYAGLAWREDADGTRIALRITDAGLRAIGIEPDEEAPTPCRPRRPTRPKPSRSDPPTRIRPPRRPRPTPRATLRHAAQAVLDTWDDDADRGALAGPMERLRAALAKPARAARDPVRRASRARAPSGRRCWRCCAGPRARPSRRSPRPPAGRRTRCAASSPGSRRRAIEVAVLERVRQVGPNKEGAKGSYTVYRVAA